MKSQKKHLVIGIPGLITGQEKSRLEKIGEELIGVTLVKPKFSGIEQDGNTIYCRFSMDDYVWDLGRVLNGINPRDYNSIGVVSSSTGAAIFAYFLAQQQFPINWYVALSPFCRLNPKVRPFVASCLTCGGDLDISSQYDLSNRVKRIIPNENIPGLLEVDCNKALTNSKRPLSIGDVLTLIGEKDERIDIEEGKNHHGLLGGREENLGILPSGHDLPYEEVARRIREFVIPKITTP